jgi:dihydroorotase
MSSEPLYDLLLTGATVIDPSQSLSAIRDVGVKGDRIVEVAENIQASAHRRIDLSGRILTPGFIDIHAHIYAGSTSWGIRAHRCWLSSTSPGSA